MVLKPLWKASALTQIYLLMLLGKGTCAPPNSGALAQLKNPEWTSVLSARADATNALDELSLHSRITGKNLRPPGSEYGSNGESTLSFNLQESVIRPLKKCVSASYRVSLNQQAVSRFVCLIDETRNQVDEISATAGKSQSVVSYYAVGSLQNARKLLRNTESFTNTITRDIPTLSIAFRLNDIFLRFLATLERYNIVHSDLLVELLNATEGNEIFSYILSYFPSDVTALYLNYNLRSSVEGSRLTEEIHGLLKYLTPSTWRNIEGLYIAGLSDKHTLSKDLSSLTKQFLSIASPKNEDKPKEYESFQLLENFLKDVFKIILKSSKSFHFSNDEMIDLKLLHNIILPTDSSI